MCWFCSWYGDVTVWTKVWSSARTNLHGPAEVALRQGRVVTRAQQPRTERRRAIAKPIRSLSRFRVLDRPRPDPRRGPAVTSQGPQPALVVAPPQKALEHLQKSKALKRAFAIANAVARARTRSAASRLAARFVPAFALARAYSRQTSSYLVDPASWRGHPAPAG